MCVATVIMGEGKGRNHLIDKLGLLQETNVFLLRTTVPQKTVDHANMHILYTQYTSTQSTSRNTILDWKTKISNETPSIKAQNPFFDLL